jgi:two-component system, OmpR family, phosphate regulon sensor histidine kinase PhoR
VRGSSIVAAVNRATSVQRTAVVFGFALLTLTLGSLAIVLSPPGTGSAAWWPGASMAVLAVASSRGTRIPAALLVLVIGALSNFVAGRELWVSIAFGFANAVEAWLVCRIASDRQGVMKLVSIASAVRFVAATLVGALSIGILAGATVAIEGGDFASSLWSIAASHASAMIVVVPLFLLPLSSYRARITPEVVIQTLLLAGVVAFVFWPGQSYPYAFLPIPILVWAAFRFRSGVVLIQSLVVALATTVLTIVGGGPFAAAAQSSPVLALHALQAFIIVLAATGLVISEGHNERDRLLAGIAARGAVLRNGILASTGGIVVIEGNSAGTLRKAVFNDGAALLFPTETWAVGENFAMEEVPASIAAPFADLVRGRSVTWSGSVDADDDRTLQVVLSRVDDHTSGFVLTVEVEDVTSRRRAAIADANTLLTEMAAVDRLTDLNRQKDDFVSSVSHELRTPVTSILGYSEELANLELDDVARGYVATITRNAQRLRSLIEDLLHVATAASAESRQAPEDVDIDELLSHMRDDLSARASEKGVSLSIGAGSLGGVVRTVRGDLERIMSNIIANAVKFTPAGGTVVVAAKRDSGKLHLRVVDTGVGIPAEDLENVFTRFFRSKTTEPVPGTGLGLPITKALVEGLGGAIHLFSDGSSGTEVLVSLPLAWPRFEL